MAENNREKGSRYEDMAAAYLIKEGLVIVERNFRCRLGEIDIIARDGEYLCFVEVKYRKTKRTGYPSEAVGASKQKKIFQVAAFYMLKNRISQNMPCRFDVISILGDEITYTKNAFGSI